MRVLNIGSLNIDYTYSLEHIVKPGETISSKRMEVFPGGKGLNQSIAIAKAGGEVYHAGLIGDDGRFLADICKAAGVNTDNIRISDERTGNAIIQVDDNGQNCIILFPGANRRIDEKFVDEVLEGFSEGDVLLLQNEVSCLSYMIDKAYERKLKIVLNPSPFDGNISECDLSKISMFLLNEVEGGQIAGTQKPDDIIEHIKKKYPEAELVLTLGEQGSIFSGRSGSMHQDAIKVKAVDTTAAGDTFTGFFISEYYSTGDYNKAMLYAATAAAISVTKKGASISIPTMDEVKKYIQEV